MWSLSPQDDRATSDLAGRLLHVHSTMLVTGSTALVHRFYHIYFRQGLLYDLMNQEQVHALQGTDSFFSTAYVSFLIRICIIAEALSAPEGVFEFLFIQAVAFYSSLLQLVTASWPQCCLLCLSTCCVHGNLECARSKD